MMQQKTSKQLYAYWDRMRHGRLAPSRHEIEPAHIPALLPETFIAECGGFADYRIRLAGTRICDQFGRELRDCSLLDFWTTRDREALESLVHSVITDGAVAVMCFAAAREDGARADFEMTLMPLIHNSETVNRLLGCVTAIEPPFWLGTAPLGACELKTFDLLWPDGTPRFLRQAQAHSPASVTPARPSPEEAGSERHRLRVIEGGLSG